MHVCFRYLLYFWPTELDWSSHKPYASQLPRANLKARLRGDHSDTHPLLPHQVLVCVQFLIAHSSESLHFAVASSPSKVGGPSRFPHLPLSGIGTSAPLHYV